MGAWDLVKEKMEFDEQIVTERGYYIHLTRDYISNGSNFSSSK